MTQTVTGYTMDTVDIRLTNSITTAAGSLGDRSGVRLRLQTADTVGLGASAPIPGASPSSSLEELAATVRQWSETAVGRDVESLLDELTGPASPPSLARFAVHTALADLSARAAGVPLRQWLRAGSPDVISTNALIAEETPKEVHAAVAAAVADGARAVKLKVGAADTGLDATRIIAASEAGSTMTLLRLDANRGWTREDAVRVIGRVGPHRIDYLEDPTSDPSEYGDISTETGVDIAVDATVDEAQRLDKLLEETGASVLVLKAGAVGGIDRILDSARNLDEGHRLVVSSSIDGPVGLLAAMNAAAALPLEGLPHGLATAPLVRDMPEELFPKNGLIRLGDEPGLSSLG